MIRVATVLGLVLLVGVACGVEPAVQAPAEATSVPQTTPVRSEATGRSNPVVRQQQEQQAPSGPTPSTNLSLQPTGVAIVQERLAEIPVYWPTIEDFELILMGHEVGVLQRRPLLRRYDRFAAVYAGRECLNGKERSFDGFRSFVGSNPDIPAQAGIVTRQIISSAEHRIALGLSAAEEGCMRPYMFPRASAELMLSVHLVQTAIAINPNNPFYEAFLTQLKQRAVSKCWDGKDQIFLRCAWKGKPE